MNSIAGWLCPSKYPDVQLIWYHHFDRAGQFAQSEGFVERRVKSAWEICCLNRMLIKGNAEYLRECASILYRGNSPNSRVTKLNVLSRLPFRITREFLTRIKIVSIEYVPYLLKGTAYLIGLTMVVALGMVSPTLVYVRKRYLPNMIRNLFNSSGLSPIPGTHNTFQQIIQMGVFDQSVDIKALDWVLPTDEGSAANPHAPKLDFSTSHSDEGVDPHAIKELVRRSLLSLGLVTTPGDQTTLNERVQAALEELQRNMDLSKRVQSLEYVENFDDTYFVLEALRKGAEKYSETGPSDQITLNERTEAALQELQVNERQQIIVNRIVRSLGCLGQSNYAHSILEALRKGAQKYNGFLFARIDDFEEALQEGEEFYRQVKEKRSAIKWS